MGEKRYGVKITLLNELKEFQLSLLNLKKKMPFIGEANFSVSFNLDFKPLMFTRRQIVAHDGKLSIGNVIYNLPGNVNMEHAENHVTIRVDENYYIRLIFDSIEEKDLFVEGLNLTESSSSDDSSDDSGRQ